MQGHLQLGHSPEPSFRGLMLAAGFARLEPDHPRAIDRRATWERDGLRAVFGDGSLRYDGKTVGIYEAEGRQVILCKIVVDPACRRQGRASRFLSFLCGLADWLEWEMYVEPWPFEKPRSIEREELCAFYARFGFMPEDAEGRVMVRKRREKE